MKPAQEVARRSLLAPMLNQWKTIATRSIVLALSAKWWFEATLIYAQATATAEAENEKSYFLAYALVLFLVALGVAIVARSGRRAEKPKMIEKELEYRLEKMSGKSGDN